MEFGFRHLGLRLVVLLWGTMAIDRQRPTDGGKGVLAEVVEVVVDEAKNVADSAGSSTRGEREQ